MALPITYSLRSLGVRWKSMLLATIGIGLVVAVFVGLLSMASGFRLALRASGTGGNAIVLEKGAMSELGSLFSKAAGDWAADDPRIARGGDGSPLVSPELVAVVALPKRSDGELTNLGIRGVTPAAFKVRTGLTIVDGRRARPGLFEIIVGKQAQNRIRGLQIGSRISLMKREFEIVGSLFRRRQFIRKRNLGRFRCHGICLQSCWHGEFADRSSGGFQRAARFR